MAEEDSEREKERERKNREGGGGLKGVKMTEEAGLLGRGLH